MFHRINTTIDQSCCLESLQTKRKEDLAVKITASLPLGGDQQQSHQKNCDKKF